MLNSDIITHGNENKYFLNGLSDGIPFISPNELNEISDYIINNFSLNDVNKIVCVESMGIPIAIALSLKMNVPVNIIRKKKFNLPSEHEIHQTTSYKNEEKLYINCLNEDDNILLVDDVIHTGGTLKPIISKLHEINVNISNIIILFEVMDGYKEVNDNYISLIKLKIEENEIQIVEN